VYRQHRHYSSPDDQYRLRRAVSNIGSIPLKVRVLCGDIKQDVRTTLFSPDAKTNLLKTAHARICSWALMVKSWMLGSSIHLAKSTIERPSRNVEIMINHV
jgi:hypothetical protein